MITYTQEEKQAVIDRVISGEPSARILADTGMPKSTFYSWLRIYREEQNAANRRTVDIRNFHLLENKVARLESIVEILKSATCTPKSPLRQRLYAAEQLYGKYNVHVICDAFDICTAQHPLPSSLYFRARHFVILLRNTALSISAMSSIRLISLFSRITSVLGS